jgi:hypothetical protein
LAASLTALPRDLAKQSETIMLAAANDAATKIRARYPVVTGTLRDSVTVVNRSTELKGHAMVTARAAYAGAFEYGVGPRPAGKVFVPTVIVERRESVRQVADAMTAQGATVTTER